MQSTFPTLSRSYKRRFAFRLSVPSFVYPADWATNVRRLGPYVDEIELLLFESNDSSLPSPAQIEELASLSRQLDISYNVHLPLDLDLGASDRNTGRYAVEQLKRIIDRVQPLAPTTHTLHLICREKSRPDIWQKQSMQNLTDLLGQLTICPRSISIETLEYDPLWFAPIVDHFDLSVCVDVGHLLLNGFDLQSVLDHYSQRIQILHLHGVANGQDHQDLDQLPIEASNVIQHFLTTFHGTVSLEMFSFDRLQRSLPCLTELMADGFCADQLGEES